MFPNEKIAIGLLSNGASTNIGVAANIKNILDDNLSQTYTMSGTQLLEQDFPPQQGYFWLHLYVNMPAQYFAGKDFFDLNGVLCILMDTHISLLVVAYDKIMLEYPPVSFIY